MYDKVNIMFAIDKTFFLNFSNLLLSPLEQFSLIKRENDSDIFVFFYGYVSDVKSCVNNFLQTINSMPGRLFYMTCFYVFYTFKVSDFKTFYDVFNYCLTHKHCGNVVELESVLDSYQKYSVLVNQINRILDSPERIVFYRQDIYKPSGSWKVFEVESTEVLSRLKPDEANVLQPAEFFQIIEKVPLLFEKFELLVFDNALRTLENYNGNKALHFNFTPNFIVSFYDLFDKIPKNKRQLVVIEINEKAPGGTINFDLQILSDLVKELNECGFKVIVDDFGEGLNNIELLIFAYKHLAGIKIGTKIFSNLFKHTGENYTVYEEIEHSLFLIKLLKSLRHLSHLAIYYEGIDSKQKLKIVSNINSNIDAFKKCYLQGFYFHKPERLSV